MYKFFKQMFLLLGCFVSLLASGQQNLNMVAPITINMPSNLSANTADWGSTVPPIIITAKAGTGGIQSWLLLTIKKGGSKICGSYSAETTPEANFNTQVKTWVGVTVVELLGNPCILSPGDYEFCVQFFAKDKRTLLGESCRPFTIKETKTQSYTPPTNLTPANEKTFTEKEAKAPLTFRWTPVIPKPKEQVVYKLRVWPVEEGQNAAQARKSNTPLLEKEVKEMTQSVERIVWPPRSGNERTSFIWNVEASKQNQMGEVELLGTSEVSNFMVAPPACTCSAIDCPKKVTYKNTITGVTNQVPNNIQTPIVLGCNVNYQFLDETVCNGDALNGCTKIVKGEFRNAAGDLVIQQTPFSSSSFFNIFSRTPGRYTFIIKYFIDDVECSTYTIPIIVSCSTGSPSCCPAQVVNNVWVKKSNGTQIETLGFINNVYKNVIISPDYYNCNEDLYLGSAMFCLDTCNKQEIYTLTNTATGDVITSVNSFKIPATLANGNYSLQIDLKCGDKICKTGTFGFEKKCAPNNDCCKNATQMPPKIVSGSGASQGILDCVNPMPFRINEKNRNCKTPLIIKAASACDANNPTCAGKVVFTLKNSSGSPIQNATNIITIPTTLLDGDYNLVIDYYCGEKICTTYSKRIIKECKPRVDCCSQSKWLTETALYTKNNYLIKKLDLNNPQLINISQGSNNCQMDMAIYAKWSCNDSANCSSKVMYTLTNNATGAYIKTDGRIDIPNTLANGKYTLKIEAYCGDSVCKVYRFPLIKDCPQTSICCLGGSWGEKAYQVNKAIQPLPKTGENIGTFKCNEIKRFKVCYNCAKQCEPAEIKYSIYMANSLIEVSSKKSKGCNPVNLTMPSVAGNYQMTITATCGGVQCTGLDYYFSVECPPVDTVDCCKNASFINPIIQDENENRLGNFGTCERSVVYFIENGFNNCNKDLFVKALPNCGNDTTNCKAKVVYTFSGSNISTIVSTQILKIPASLPTGQYFLQIDYYCGNKICKSCKFEIKKQCPPPTDCCKNTSFKDPAIMDSEGNSLGITLNCNAPKILYINEANKLCDKDFMIKASFNCGIMQQQCPSNAVITLKNRTTGAKLVNTTPGGPFSNYLIVPATLPDGSYALTIDYYCGNKICKTCTFEVKKDCKTNDDCCVNSTWEEKIYYLNGSQVPTIFPEDKAGSLGDFDCKKNMKVKVCFKCGSNCTATIDYKIYTNTGILQSSKLNILSCTDVSLTIPNANGKYVLMLVAKCNGKVCDSLGYFFRVDNCTPLPTNCCKNATWKKAQYEIVNKKADGSWDYSDATLYNFSISRVAAIPTIKADLGVSVENLLYQCFNAAGCEAEYIITRKNMTTGTFEPEEKLTAGKNDASVYSKPYPQLITIVPLCGGQKCDKGIEFYLECVNKDCVVTNQKTDTCGNEGTVYFTDDTLNLKKFSPTNNLIEYNYGTRIYISMDYSCGSVKCKVQSILGQEFEGSPHTYTESLIADRNGNSPWIFGHTLQFTGKLTLKVFCCGKLCSTTFITLKRKANTATKNSIISSVNNRNYFVTKERVLEIKSSYSIEKGLFKGIKKMLSLTEVAKLVTPILLANSEIKELKVVEIVGGNFQMIVNCINDELKLIQSVIINLEKDKNGFLQLAERATVISQSIFSSLTKNPSPGGGTCSKCGATFTDEQKFILHQANCEYTSISSKISSKKHDYVGHVTLLK